MQTALDPTIQRTENFAQDAASLILKHGHEAIARSGLFRLGLAGGNTPKAVYQILAQHAATFPWAKVQITFGDERCVAPDHPDSNFRMAREALLDAVGIPVGNVFRIRGEISADQAALECEQQLKVMAARFNEPVYRHDLLLLGLGEDGHTASLFPDSPALEEKTLHVVATVGPKPPPQRVTFTYPLINSARCVAFLLKDPAKESVFQQALAGLHPAGKVKPTDGNVVWIVGT